MNLSRTYGAEAFEETAGAGIGQLYVPGQHCREQVPDGGAAGAEPFL